MRKRPTTNRRPQGKRPTKTTPEDTKTTTTRTNNKTTRTKGTKQRNSPPTRNRLTKTKKQKRHKTEKPEKPKRKNEKKLPHIKSIKKKKRYFSFFFYINALVEVSCSFEVWLVGLEVWAYNSFLDLCALFFGGVFLGFFGLVVGCVSLSLFSGSLVSVVGLLPCGFWFLLFLNVVSLL